MTTVALQIRQAHLLRISAHVVAAYLAFAAEVHADEQFVPVPLQSRITHVQPMTGIVFWSTSQHNRTDAIQLEYSYMKYGDVVSARGRYDWSAMDRLLEQVAARGHQAIVRFYFVYPGRPTTVPRYIKGLADYHETEAKSEGKPTGFADWSHNELKRFTLEFYENLAQRYDADPRLAFLETGFGLWAEYHIYSGPMRLGKTFPDKAFQADFARKLSRVFHTTPWLISVDAADDSRAPFVSDGELMKLAFGVFDDSFLCQQHARENEPNWNAMSRERWKRAPAGGEFSYYTGPDQKLALAPTGPHGISFEQAAAAFHITFMIGDGQPRYQPMARISAAGMACGYRFRIRAFEASPSRSRVEVANTGVAPIYHDAYLEVNGVRAGTSLKGLLPGQSRTDDIASGGAAPKLTIGCDRLVPGQSIQFEADLPPSGK
jgi:hypothetical protein